VPAHGQRVRARARDLYAEDRLSLPEIARRTGVSLSQLKRWKTEGMGWDRYRDLVDRQKEAALEAAVALAEAATSSLDAQQMYAAEVAARSAGVGRDKKAPARRGPAPGRVIRLTLRAMIGVLANDPDVGPAMAGHRGRVLELVEEESKRLLAKYASEEETTHTESQTR
jgi:hypothetical protein